MDIYEEYAHDIIEFFEELLNRHNIDIPDDDREGDEEEARIYGCTYFDLETDIANFLRENTKPIIRPLIFHKETEDGRHYISHTF